MRRRHSNKIWYIDRKGQKYRRFETLIPESTFRKTEQVIAAVIGYYKGVWSDVITEALEKWVSEHTIAHNKRNPRPNVVEAWSCVKSWLLRNIYDEIPNTIPGEFLQEGIRGGLNVRDYRSVRSWLETFRINGLIKPLQIIRNPLKVRLWEIIAK